MNKQEIQAEIARLRRLEAEFEYKEHIEKLANMQWEIGFFIHDKLSICPSYYSFFIDKVLLIDNESFKLDNKFFLFRDSSDYYITFDSLEDFKVFIDKYQFKINYHNFLDELEEKIDDLKTNLSKYEKIKEFVFEKSK